MNRGGHTAAPRERRNAMRIELALIAGLIIALFALAVLL